MPRPLKEVAQRLADVLARENDALRGMDLRSAAMMLHEKTGALAELAAQGDAGIETPALAAAIRHLNGLALENRRLLQRAITAQQRVIGIIVGAASATAVRPCYGNKGRRAGAYGPMALSTRA